MNERLKTHSKTQKKSADLVSNKLRIGVFQRYQMKCKSVSKKSPRYTGDTLSAISKQVYGNANLYNKIFEANKPMLKSPDKIYPGQVLRIPEE